MWQRMWELCVRSADYSGTDSHLALIELLNDGALQRGCEQAVRDGLGAQLTLERCYEVLSSPWIAYLFDTVDEDLNGIAQAEVLRQVATARAVIEASKLSLGAGSPSDLLRWLAHSIDPQTEFNQRTRIGPIDPFPPDLFPAEFSGAGCINMGFTWLRERRMETGRAQERALALLEIADKSSVKRRGSAQAPSAAIEESQLQSLSAAAHQSFPLESHLWDLPDLREVAAKQQLAREEALASGSSMQEPPSRQRKLSWVNALTDSHMRFLIRLLSSSNARIRQEALTILWGFAGEIARNQRHDEWRARITPKLLCALANCFTEPVDSVRELAVSAAGALALLRTHRSVQEGLLPLLCDPVDGVRAAVAMALTLSSPPSPSLIGSLAQLLTDPSSMVRSAAAQCLAPLELDARLPGLTAALGQALSSPVRVVIKNVVKAIGNLRPSAPPELIVGVVQLLNDPDASVRAAAVNALACSAETARTSEVFAALTPLLHDPDRDVRTAVARAIGAFDKHAPPELRDGLGQLLLDRDRTVLQEVATAICRLGRSAVTASILERIALLLSREEGPLLVKAVGALGSSAAIPSILQGLAGLICKCEEAFTVAQSLGRKAFRQTLLLYADLFRHPERSVHRDAVGGAMMLRGGLAVPEFLEQIVQLLRHENADTRSSAVAAVEAMGTAAFTPQIRDALYALRTDSDDYVRYKAEQTIRALDPDCDVE